MNLLATLILLEANVYNINDPYNNVSVKSYVTKMLQQIGEGPIKQQLIKKIIKLITNDDTLLVPITELPDNAPEWAKSAAYAGDLKAFQPSEDVNDKMSHIAHFIKAAYDDSSSDNKDIASHASKELNGLVKVETLTVLYTKANEYFARGSRKVSRQADGMEHVADTGKYQWYELRTQEALAREGKTLQNCIGRIYTYDRLKRDRAKIFVMRDKNGNSAVAMRVSFADASNPVVQEFKGKNNRPPVPQYMPSVIEFVQKSNFRATNAASDFLAAGYYVDDKGNIITVAQAMDTLMDVKQISRTATGHTVVRITSYKTDLLRQMTRSYRDDHHSYTRCSAQYQLRNGSDVIAAATCTDPGILSDVWVGDRQPRSVLAELLRGVASTGEVREVDPTLKRMMPIMHLVHYDGDNNTVDDVVPDSVQKMTVDGVEADIATYTGESAKHMGESMLWFYNTNDRDSYHPTKVHIIPVASTTNAYGAPKITSYVETAEGVVIPVAIASTGVMYRSTNTADGSVKDNITRDTAIQLANSTEQDLPLDYCAMAGIHRNKGQYEQYTPSPVAVTHNIAKFDLTGLPESTKFIATKMCSNATHDRNSWSYAPYNSISYRAKSALAEFVKGFGSHYGGLYRSDEDAVKSWNVMKAAYGNKSPDVIYVPSSPSVSKFVVLASGGQIISIDTFGAFQGRLSGSERAAVSKVVQCINELADTNDVKLTRASCAGLPTSIKFDSKTNRLVSSVDKQANKLGAASSDEFTMTMENGTVIKRMPADEFKAWQETLNTSSLTGCEFYVLDQENRTGHSAVIAVKPKSKQIYQVYTKGAHNDGDTPPPLNNEHVALHLAPYINAFAIDQGITRFPSNSALTEKSTMYRVLRQLSTMTGANRRGSVMKAAGVSTSNPTVEEWLNTSAPYKEYLSDRTLIGLGLATGNVEGAGRMMLGPTIAGKEAFRKIRSGEITSMYQLVPARKGSSTKAEPKAPEPKPAAPVDNQPRERAPRAADGQSKAARAMTRFRELAAGGTIPARGEFIRILQNEFDMTPAGASTYYHNLKVKYAQEQGRLGETFTFAEYLAVMME